MTQICNQNPYLDCQIPILQIIELEQLLTEVSETNHLNKGLVIGFDKLQSKIEMCNTYNVIYIYTYIWQYMYCTNIMGACYRVECNADREMHILACKNYRALKQRKRRQHYNECVRMVVDKYKSYQSNVWETIETLSKSRDNYDGPSNNAFFNTLKAWLTQNQIVASTQHMKLWHLIFYIDMTLVNRCGTRRWSTVLSTTTSQLRKSRGR